METRVQRHKNYRAELIKEGSNVTISEKPLGTTTALPIKEVIDTVEDDRASLAFYKKKRNEKVAKYVFLVIFLVICIIGLIMFGLYAFRG